MSINGQPTEGSPLLTFDHAASTSDDDDGVDGLSMSKPVRIFCGCLALLQLGAVGYIAATPYAPEDPEYYHKNLVEVLAMVVLVQLLTSYACFSFSLTNERSYLAVQSGTRNAALMMLLVQLAACCWVVTAVVFVEARDGDSDDSDDDADNDADVANASSASNPPPLPESAAGPATFPSLSKSYPWFILGGCCAIQLSMVLCNRVRLRLPDAPQTRVELKMRSASHFQRCCGVIQVLYPGVLMANNRDPTPKLVLSGASGLLAILGACLMAANLACFTWHSKRLLVASALASFAQVGFSVWSLWWIWTADPPGLLTEHNILPFLFGNSQLLMVSAISVVTMMASMAGVYSVMRFLENGRVAVPGVVEPDVVGGRHRPNDSSNSPPRYHAAPAMPQPVRPALADPAPATPADFMGDAEMMLTGDSIHNPPSYSQVMTEDIRAQLFLSNTSPAACMPDTAAAAMCSLTCVQLAELCDETDGCRGTGQGIVLQQVTGLCYQVVR